MEFAASKEVADLHGLLDVFLCVFGEKEVFKASAYVGYVLAVVIGKYDDVSACGDNDLKKLIPKGSVGSCYRVGIVDNLHTEAALIILKNICKIRNVKILM